MFVFAGPFDIEPHTEKANPALTELLRQPDPLDVDDNALHVVWDEMEYEGPVIFELTIRDGEGCCVFTGVVVVWRQAEGCGTVFIIDEIPAVW